MTRIRASHSGVSLIEALLALVVMSVGMLAVVSMQSTLRNNGDLSRQRAEAVRLAQMGLEANRSFSRIEADASRFDFSDILSRTDTFTRTSTNPLNADYTRVLSVTDNSDPVLANGWPSSRTLSVRVTWRDRTGQLDANERPQFVELHSTVTGVAPELAGSLALPPQGTPARLPRGRNAAIPPTAVTQPDGTSRFIPPQTAGTPVAWYFNNQTGLITRICTDASDLSTCSSTTAQFVTGYVRFALQLSPPASTAATNPPHSWTDLLPIIYPALTLDARMSYTTSINATAIGADCFVGATSAETAAPTEYFCVLPLSPNVPNQVPTWSGRLSFSTATTPNKVTDDPSDGSLDKVRVCRYFDLSGSGSYAAVAQALTNQNYLIIRAGSGSATGFACPAGPTVAHTAS